MICPSCKLENPASAIHCDCGFNFRPGEAVAREQRRAAAERVGEAPDEKRFSEMTGTEVRKIITSGVANGVLLAGLVLLFLAVLVGFALGLARV